jgi:hypothetical protein
MKLNVLFISLALSFAVSGAFAAGHKKAETHAKPAETSAKPADASKDDKAVLKADAAPEVKAAIEAADKADSAAKKAGFEWFVKDKTMSDYLQDAIKASNDGDKETALKLAKKVEAAGTAGLDQAEKAKTAGPTF